MRSLRIVTSRFARTAFSQSITSKAEGVLARHTGTALGVGPGSVFVPTL